MADSSGTTGTSDDVRVLVRALDQAGDVLDHLHADDLGKPSTCEDWDVSTLADHLMATPPNFLTMMAGGQPDWDVPAPHVSHSWGPGFRVRADDLTHRWHEHRGEAPVPIGMMIAELAIHAWDLARSIDFPVERLDPEVAKTALGFLRANLKPGMRGQAFADEREPAADAGPYERLAAYAGRQT